MWQLDWVERNTPISIKTPEFKCCKKRKDFYSFQFQDIFYKSPYKYHLRIRLLDIKEPIHLICKTVLTFEDESKVQIPKSNKEPMSMSIATFKPSTKDATQMEAVLGPFQFNVCSYKYDGKKFKLKLFLCKVDPNKAAELYKKQQKKTSQMMNDLSMMVSGTLDEPPLLNATKIVTKSELQKEDVPYEGEIIGILTSPSFILRAKKPIHNPGAKKRKRNATINNSSSHMTNTNRNRKQETSAPENMMETSLKFERQTPTMEQSNMPGMRTLQDDNVDDKRPMKKKFSERDLNPDLFINYFQACTSDTRKRLLDGILGSAYPMELIYLQHQLVSSRRGLCEFFLNPNFMQNQIFNFSSQLGMNPTNYLQQPSMQNATPSSSSMNPHLQQQQQQQHENTNTVDLSMTNVPPLAMYNTDSRKDIDDIFEDVLNFE